MSDQFAYHSRDKIKRAIELQRPPLTYSEQCWLYEMAFGEQIETRKRCDVRYAHFRNKPAERVRPYTFEEAKRFVGKPVVHKAQAFSNVCLLVVSAWVCNDSGDVMFSLSRSDTPHLGDWMLKNYTHPDGSPFGVVENE